MKKLTYLILLFAISLFLTSCQKQETPSFSIAFINSSDNAILDYANDNLENYAVVDLNNSEYSASYYLERIEDYSIINSIMVFDETVDDNLASELIEFIKPHNVPISFAFANLSEDTLNSYDKAYNFTLDYTYMGEVLAKKADALWTSGTLDTNSSLLLEFSSLGYSNQNENEIELYTSFVKNIELLGIPYSILSEDYIDVPEQAVVILSENTKSETIVILDNQLLNEVYQSYTGAAPLIGFNFSTLDRYTDSSILFVDYSNYFDTSLKIFENIENKIYPFTDISLPLEGKTFYLTPTR